AKDTYGDTTTQTYTLSVTASDATTLTDAALTSTTTATASAATTTTLSTTDALFTLLADRLALLEEINPAMLDAWLSAEDLLGSNKR
ncbi:MAG: hypothetical protein ACRELG_07775, partial [Gemmataceae bacterium]